MKKQFKKVQVEKKKKEIKLKYPVGFDSSSFIHQSMEKQMKKNNNNLYESNNSKKQMASKIK